MYVTRCFIVTLLYVFACWLVYKHCTCVQVGPRDIEYVKEYQSDEKELQYAVEEHLYPPAICYDIVQSQVPKHLQSHKRIQLHIHGAKEGVITFPIVVLEEGVSWLCGGLVYVCWHHFWYTVVISLYVPLPYSLCKHSNGSAYVAAWQE